MATSDRGTGPAPSDDSASRIHDAEFVAVSTSPTGDAIAGTAMLVRALQSQSIPFHVRVGAAPSVSYADRVITVGVGDHAGEEPDIHLPAPAAAASADLAGQLGMDLDPVQAAVARCSWESDTASTEDEADVDPEEGVAIPVGDAADGIAHSTLVRGPWSGPDATAALSASAENDAALASLVVVDALAHSADPERTVDAVDRAIAPIRTPEAPFATVEGFAEVLDAIAAADPGAALAAACEPGAGYDAALDSWRRTATEVHARLDDGPTTEEGEIAVYRAAGSAVHVVARLARDYETTAPIVAGIGEGNVAVATVEPDPIETLRAASPEPIEAWYRHGGELLRGTCVDPSAAESAVLEALA